MSARSEVYGLLVVIALFLYTIAYRLGASFWDAFFPSVLLMAIVVIRGIRGER